MARRNQIVSIRLNEEEETFLMERISALNISQSEYVRNLIRKDYNESRIDAVLRTKSRDPQRRGYRLVKTYTFRLTQGEYDHLNSVSNSSGISASGILRSMIRNMEAPKLPSIDEKYVIVQLKRIGNNINQIARVANTTQAISELYLRENLADLEDVLNRIRYIYGI